MAVFTVHEPKGLEGRGFAAARRVVFVKEGFCWPALFVPVLWLLFNRMWLLLLAYLVAVAAAEAALQASGSVTFAGLGGFALALLFALIANDVRRWHLGRKGYVMRGIVAGGDRDECERRFFADWLEARPAPRRASPTNPTPTASAAPAPHGHGVVGMFPEPGGR